MYERWIGIKYMKIIRFVVYLSKERYVLKSFNKNVSTYVSKIN